MIVTCEECSTSFQLDEARIPATGARVRCSRCKHAFFLPNPSASQSEAIDSIAEEAAGDSLSSVPTATPDLSSSLADDPLASSATAAPDSDEEDWEFSEEIRIEGEGEGEGEADEDLSSSGVFGTALDVEAASDEFQADDLEPSGLDIESNVETEAASEPEPDAEPESSATPPVRDESDFGTVDDFSSLMEEDDAGPLDLATDGTEDLEIEQPSESVSSVYTSTGTTDDLGDPESWDLVGSDDFAASGKAASLLQRQTAPSALDPIAAAAHDVDGHPFDVEVGPASFLRRALGDVSRGVGWAATIATIGTVLFLGLSSEWNRDVQRPQTVTAGPLTAETTRTIWVETSRAGYVLVVEGEVRNEGQAAMWPGTLQFALLDAEGIRLAQEPIRAGAPLPDSVLREGSPDRLVESAEAAAQQFGKSPMGPGEVRRFAAIALEDRLPEGARRVLLEMSSPGVVTRLPAVSQASESEN